MFAISRKHVRNDFNVAMLFPTRKEKCNAAFQKIDQALALLFEFDRPRYLRTRRLVKKIWIFPTPPDNAQWMDELKMCILDTDFLCQNDISPAQVAATIVHETTHARLDRAKMKYTEEMRFRME